MDVKIFYTSNLLLDNPYDFIPDNKIRGKVIQHKLDSFIFLIDLIKEERPDALIFCGNLFNFSKINLKSLEFLKNQLNRIPHIPIFITPGDKDPLTIGSFYTNTEWGKHIHIFKNEQLEPFYLKNKPVVIWGAACKNILITPESLAPPNITKQTTKLHNIVTFHGFPYEDQISKTTASTTDKSFPFHVESFTKNNSFNLLIGNSNLYQEIKHENFFFSGSLFFNDFLDFNSGFIKKYVFSSSEGHSITPVPVASINLKKIEFDIESYNDFDDLLKNLKNQLNKSVKERDVVYLVLKGKSKNSFNIEINKIEQYLGSYTYSILENKISSFLDWENYLHQPNLKGCFLRLLEKNISEKKLPCLNEDQKENIIYYGLTSLMKNGTLKTL